ncbi:PadR family transcriptional regulator [Sphingomonas sp. PB2P19]
MSWEIRGGERHGGRHEHGRGFGGDFGAGFGRGFGGGFGGGGFGGGGGRSRRMFDGGELKLVLLKLIADTPRHGYDLIREIEAMTGGAYAPSPGVVYPTLTLLDEMNLIAEQQSEGAKKRFAATDEGQAMLAEQQETVEALFARLAALNAESERTDSASIRRAVGNLRHVLQHRMARGDVSEETLHQVTALIDEVAQKIERLK